MQVCEFKAWFDGFTENIEGPPTAKQWKRIKARVKEIDGNPVTPVYIERHYRRYNPWITYCSNGVISETMSTAAGHNGTWNTTTAMTAIGQAEAKSLDLQAN